VRRVLQNAHRMRTIIEPFRIKAVEPIAMSTREEREQYLEAGGHNLFQVPARAVIVDLLTDSGTSAMSAAQWSALMRGDESYAGSESFFRLRDVVRRLTGFDEIIPVHQGRAAERIAFGLLAGPGKVVPGNTHFDTTRANIEATGAEALDLPCKEGLEPEMAAPFKGNIDLDRLAVALEQKRGRVACVVITVTNNALGGQPVSLDNLHSARTLSRKHGVPLFLDSARFAENAYLAKSRDPELADSSIAEVARMYFDLVDGFLMSCKKDALVNNGGLLAFRDKSLTARARTALVVTEGFPTYGGLAARDLEAIARGLVEATDPTYLGYRAAITRYMAAGLDRLGVPYVRPEGLHAIYVDAGKFLPHLQAEQFPGHALAVELFRVAGVRTCEIGTLLRGSGHGAPELLRLAIPRRVYTQSHMDYVLEAFEEIARTKSEIPGYRIVEEPPTLRHFTARLQPVEQGR
jgi:tryptophanase